MAPPRLEDLFQTFRATRDPSALAAVFDATASELLLVAVHLVGDRAEAEDLVQTTFVELIERSGQYDPSRPLKPWLIGVLANRAKMVQRRRRRAPARDLTDTEAAATPGPVEAAEASEVAEHVSAALDSLPSHYRHILVLHLVHGLGGVQIAQSLDRPPATVRTQIRRGLEMLRGALPAALAVPAALFATEGRGLAAVRSAVLEKAGTGLVAGAGGVAATATLAATAGGLVGMKKLILAAMAAVLVLGAWYGFDAATPALPRGSGAAAPEPIRAAAPVEDGAGAPSPAARSELARPQAAPRADTVTLRGRIVGERDGKPRQAETIYVRANPERWQDRDPNVSWPVNLATGASSPAGEFEFSFTFDDAVQHRIEIYGAGFAGVSGDVAIEGPGVHDMGDIVVRHGARLLGRVVDEAGTVVPNVAFQIEYPWARLTGESRSMTFIQSDGQGVLRMRNDARVMAGEATLKPTSGWEIVRGAEFRLSADREFAEPLVVVRRQGGDRMIRGRVVDERGVGVAGSRLHPLGRGYEDQVQRDRTEADGNFTVYRRASDPERPRLLVSGSSSTVGVQTDPVDWGTENLVIVQPACRTVEVVVVDALDGSPVEDFVILHGATTDPLWRHGELDHRQQTGPHPGGRVTLRGIPVSGGELVVAVAPGGTRHALSGQLRFAIDSIGHAPVEVRVQRRRPVQVRVVDAAGHGVGGSEVRVVQLEGVQTLDADTLVVAPDVTFMNFDPAFEGRFRLPYFVDNAQTGANGTATLRCVPDGRLGLLVTGRHVTRFIAPAALDEDAAFEVVVEAGAMVRCRVDRPELLTRFSRNPAKPDHDMLRLAVRRPGGRILQAPGETDDGFLFDAAGQVEIGGLAPGRWELVLSWMRPLDPSTLRQTVLEPPLATVNLGADAVQDVRLDLSRVLPGRMRGTLLVDGRPLRHASILVERSRRGADGEVLREPGLGAGSTDAEGRFHVGGLLPGDYRVCVGVTGEARTLHSAVIPVAVGADLDQVIELR